MTLTSFQTLIYTILSQQKEIIHVLNSDGSLLVSCDDGSNFFINVLESRRTFIHEDCNEETICEYLSAHTKEDFTQDILNLASSHPSFFMYFLIFTRLEEMRIIDRGLLYHIIDNIIFHENELDEFMAKLISHIKSNHSD